MTKQSLVGRIKKLVGIRTGSDNQLSGELINSHDSQQEITDLELVGKDPWAIGNIKNPSEQVQLAAVSQDGRAIRFIRNPSERVQLAAVNQDGRAIRYIQNPSIRVQLAAVNEDGNAIQFIQNPSLEVQLAAVKQNSWAIGYIQNPSLDVQLAAVSQEPWAIGNIKNPSERVQLAAVNQNGNAIQYIQNPSERVQLAAVNQNGNAIQYIQNPSPNLFTDTEVKRSVIKSLLTSLKNGDQISYLLNYLKQHQVDWPELEKIRAVIRRTKIGLRESSHDINQMSERDQIVAVRRNAYAIKDILDPSEQVQLAAIEKIGARWALALIDNPTERVQLMMVQKEPILIEYIKNPSERVQLAAVEKDEWAIRNIKNPTDRVQIAAIEKYGEMILWIHNFNPALLKNQQVKTSVLRTILSAMKFGLSHSDPMHFIKFLRNHNVTWPELNKIESALSKLSLRESSHDINSMSEEEQVEYIRFNWRDIRNIHNPSERVQLAAIYKDMSSLTFIKEPTLFVQKYAILNNPFSIRVIKNVNPALFRDNEVKNHVVKYLLKIVKSGIAASCGIDLLNLIENHDHRWKEIDIIKNALIKKQIDDK